MRRAGLTLTEMIVVLFILMALASLLVPMIGGVNTEAQYTTTKATMASLRNAVVQYYQDMKGIQLPRTPPGTTLATDASGIPQTLKDLLTQPAIIDINGNPVAYNPVSGRGWRGPYVLQATGAFQPLATKPVHGVSLDASFYPTVAGVYLFGNPGDPAYLDAWGNPIVLEWPAVGTSGLTNPQQDFLARAQQVRLVSAGAPKSGSASVLDTVTLTGGVLPWMPTRPTTTNLTLTDQRGNDILLFILIQDPYPWTPKN